MAFRSPTGAGLAVQPNAGVVGTNPAATNQELQSHMYWGRYSGETFLPNVGTVGGVGVAGANPLALPGYDQLRPGDLAFVAFTSCLYICTDRGTAGGNDANWNCLAVAAAPTTQTVRDAHTMVVGQDNYLTALAGVAQPPLAANQLNLAATGDVVGVTCDYLDPGDGSELQFALAAALAGGIPVDIRLRPCSLTLTGTTVGASGFSVPALCRLLGAGKNLSALTGTSAATFTQTVVTLGLRSALEDLLISSPAPLGAPGGTQVGVVECAGISAEIRNCNITLERSVTVNRVSTAAINAGNPGDGFLVENCGLFVDSLRGQVAPAQSYGVRLGIAGAGRRPVRDPQVRNVVVDEASIGVGAGGAVLSLNCEGGRFSNIEASNGLTPDPTTGAFGWVWSIAGALTTPLRGPRYFDCVAETLGNEAAGSTAFRLSVTAAAVGFGSGLRGATYDHCEARFDEIINPNPGITKQGFHVSNLASDTSELREVEFTACKVIGDLSYTRGFNIDTSGSATSAIRSVRLTACQARAARDGYAVPPNGCVFRTNLGGSVISEGSVQGCDFSNIQGGSTSNAMDVEDANVVNTIVLGNNLTPGATGVGLFDLGTGTEAAHNIV